MTHKDRKRNIFIYLSAYNTNHSKFTLDEWFAAKDFVMNDVQALAFIKGK